MAKKFEIEREFSYSTDDAYQAIVSEEAIAWRYKTYEGLTYETSSSGDEHTLKVNIPISNSVLPAVVTKVLRGGLVIHRTDVWGPLTDGKATGTFIGKSGGMPSTSEGTYTLEPTENGCRLRATGSVTVKIPLVGGKIEDASIQLVKEMFRLESDAAEKWVTTHG